MSSRKIHRTEQGLHQQFHYLTVKKKTKEVRDWQIDLMIWQIFLSGCEKRFCYTKQYWSKAHNFQKVMSAKNGAMPSMKCKSCGAKRYQACQNIKNIDKNKNQDVASVINTSV